MDVTSLFVCDLCILVASSRPLRSFSPSRSAVPSTLLVLSPTASSSQSPDRRPPLPLAAPGGARWCPNAPPPGFPRCGYFQPARLEHHLQRCPYRRITCKCGAAVRRHYRPPSERSLFPPPLGRPYLQECAPARLVLCCCQTMSRARCLSATLRRLSPLFPSWVFSSLPGESRVRQTPSS